MAESYVEQKLGIGGRVREAVSLYRMHAHELPRKVSDTIERLRQIEREVEGRFGLKLEGLKMLDVGPGQMLPQMGYFSVKNDVTGIDLDLVPQGINPLSYLRMLKVNGPTRTAKTVARKMLGLDARVYGEMQRQIGAKFRKFRLVQMDATKMTFPRDHFDFVYSVAVFEHLPDPAAVLDRVAEVLKPGAVAHIGLHLYTSESGAHDMRILSENRGDLPYWAHLRPRFEHLIQSNSYLNRLRLAQWKQIFDQHLPGAQFICRKFHVDEFQPKIDEIRKGGELQDYTDEELLTGEFVAIWQKPVTAAAGANATAERLVGMTA